MMMFYNDTEESQLQEWNGHMALVFIPATAFLALCFVVGTVANPTVVIVVLFRMKSSRDDRYFIPFLSFVDLLGLTLNCLGAWLQYFPYVHDNDSLFIPCKLYWFGTSGIASFSAFILIAIAIQRYLKICRPHGKQMDLKIRRLYLAVALFISAIIAFPFTLFYDMAPIESRMYNVTGYICSRGQSKWLNNEPVIYSVTIASLVFINILLLMIIYCSIGKTIYRQTRLKNRRKLSAKRRMGRINLESSFDVESLNERENVTLKNGQADDISEYSDWTLDRRGNNKKRFVGSEMSTLPEYPTGNSFDLDKMRDIRGKTKSLQHYRHLRKRIDRFTWMFLIMTMVAMVSYVPRATLLMFESLDSQFWISFPDFWRSVVEVAYRLHALHHACNALIYGYFDTRFRAEVKKFCKRVSE
ncbi:neuromedin-U receptor 2-like [Saccostrea echinata]|uniref:neuromedin-U receptor 2-like n=1 Tax=Saccostrea echinata TaxID=191078 RepID=UPI002A838EFB|nr:neuromedin-U receptor 2-like [Saccostrea echinata]